MPAYRPSPARVRNLVRETLAGAGLTEVVTHALIDPLDGAKLRWPEDAAAPALLESLAAEAGGEIAVTNPLSAQHSVLQQSLAGSLLDVLSLNERQGRADVAVYEIGKRYARVDGKPREWTRLGLLLSGAAEPSSWNRTLRQYDLDDVKGIVELLCRRLGLPVPSYTPDHRGYPFHPGRALTATSVAGDEAVTGRLAELHPDLLAAWELRAQRVVVAEIAIAGLDVSAPLRVHVESIPRFPEVERDLAVIVEDERFAAEVQAAIERHGGDLLRRVRLFDVYRGAPLVATEKSLAYRLEFGSPERTLTEAEIDAAVAQVRNGLTADLGAHIRS